MRDVTQQESSPLGSCKTLLIDGLILIHRRIIIAGRSWENRKNDWENNGKAENAA